MSSPEKKKTFMEIVNENFDKALEHCNFALAAKITEEVELRGLGETAQEMYRRIVKRQEINFPELETDSWKKKMPEEDLNEEAHRNLRHDNGWM